MLRAAAQTDGHKLASLLFHDLKQRRSPLLKSLTDDQLEQTMFRGLNLPGFLYDYRRATVYENQGVAVGVLMGGVATVRDTLDNGYDELLAKLSLPQALHYRTATAARDDEWFINVLAVRDRYQGKTYQQRFFNEWLMMAAIRQARAAGVKVVGIDLVPGTDVATWAAEFGFLASPRVMLDGVPTYHARLKLVGL